MKKRNEADVERLLRETLAAEASHLAPAAEEGADRAWGAAQSRIQAGSAGGRRPFVPRWAAPALVGLAVVAVVAFFGVRPMLLANRVAAPNGGVPGPGFYAPSGPVTYGPNTSDAGADVGYYPPGMSLADLADPAVPSQGGVQSSGPAPVFRNTFRPTSDPFPPHVGQPVTFVSQPGWQGQRVWVYVAPAKEQRTIMYDRRLPKDAILIGIADIDPTDGHWTLVWTIPHAMSHGDSTISFDGPDTWFNVVAVTDTGYLAGSGLPVGPNRTLEVSPADVTAGQALAIRGSGYPANERIRLDIMHDRPESVGGTDLEVTIGWVRTDAEGRFRFDYQVPAEFNWVFADNTGKMQDHRLTAGAPGTFSVLAVEYEAGAEHGYATLEKQVGVHAAE